MPTYTAADAECLVYTFKEGLLSKVAHDLKLRVATFELTVAEDAIEGRFDPSSLRVVCARKDGQDDPSVLSESDKAKIKKNIRADVLQTKRYDSITFRSTEVARDSDQATVRGELTLHGVTRPIVAQVRREGSWWQTEVTLHQPDFGIKPFSAMLGALKVQPDVRVQLRVPA